MGLSRRIGIHEFRKLTVLPGERMNLFDACFCLPGLPQCLLDLHNFGREAVKSCLPPFVGFFVEYAEHSAIAFSRFREFSPDVISRMPRQESAPFLPRQNCP